MLPQLKRRVSCLRDWLQFGARRVASRLLLASLSVTETSFAGAFCTDAKLSPIRRGC